VISRFGFSISLLWVSLARPPKKKVKEKVKKIKKNKKKVKNLKKE